MENYQGPHGINFQTSLEVRWAEFFENLKLDWKYNNSDINSYTSHFIITIPNTTDQIIIEVTSATKYNELKKFNDKSDKLKYPHIIVGDCLFYKNDINETQCSVNQDDDDIPCIGLLKAKHDKMGKETKYEDVCTPVFISSVDNVAVFYYWYAIYDLLYDLKNRTFIYKPWCKGHNNKYIENLWIDSKNKYSQKFKLK